MKPAFALSLSFDGISLLHRCAGGWRTAGDVALTEPDLNGALAGLRKTAAQLDDAPLRVKIIIPNEQIKYLTVETGMADAGNRNRLVRQALEGATPYAVDDLVFDISVEGANTHVAAIARETLDEAEGFAVEHKFGPVSFVAIPDDKPFLGEPFFGPTRHASVILSESDRVEPDGIAVVVVGPAEIPPARDPVVEHAAPPPESIEAPMAGVIDASVPFDPGEPIGDDAPAPGFASRRRRTPEPTPQPVTQVTRAEPEVAAPSAPAPPAPPAVRADPVTPDTVPPVPAALAGSLRAVPVDDPAPEKPRSGFLSRRKTAKPDVPPPAAPPPPAPPPIATTTQMPPALAAAVRKTAPDSQTAPEIDETDRMTVFGARKPTGTRGKPRHLGLIMTAVLLLFLAGVAAWASIFLDETISSLFSRSDKETEIAEVPPREAPAPTPAPATVSASSIQVNVPAIVAPQADSGPTLAQPIQQDDPVALASVAPGETGLNETGLSETDAAVLDALRTPEISQAPDAADNQQPEPPRQDQAATPQTPPAQAEVRYASTGIWQQAPQSPEAPGLISLDDLYLGTIDNRDLAHDAVALPDVASLDTDVSFAALSSPTSADTQFDRDQNGLVIPTPEGALTPNGVIVYLGRPAAVPPPTPTRFATQPETDAIQDRLAGLRPRVRPQDLSERNERSQLGGLTRNELAGVRPRLRPETAKTTTEEDETPTAQAVATSRRPAVRPKDFASRVKPKTPASTGTSGSGAERGSTVATVAPRTVTPKIPSSASVARQATLENSINLRQVNLIGVYGTPSNRRALVRLPSGRYKKVSVGDSIDGGRVSAIGDSELRYQKGGRNLVLKIPSG